MAVLVPGPRGELDAPPREDMRNRLVVMCAVMAVLTLPETARAQWLPEGTAVRIRQRGDTSQVVGKVVSQTRDSLIVVHPSGGPAVRFALNQLDRVEASVGERSRRRTMWTYGALGAATGVALGAAVVLLRDDGEESIGISPGQLAVLYAVPAGMLGGVIGAGLGARSPTTRWRRICCP